MPTAARRSPHRRRGISYGETMLTAEHSHGLHVVRHHVDAPGPPVVLVHGGADRSRSFASIVRRLGDLPVTVYDRRGYGESLSVGADGDRFDTHADDLIAILDGTPSVVVGHSAGGTIAMLTATRAPELFLALGVWEPPMAQWEWWPADARRQAMEWGRAEDAEAAGEQFNRLILGDARWEQLPDHTRRRLQLEAKAFRADMASQDNLLFELDQLVVPRLLGCGTRQSVEFDGVHQRTAEMAGCDLLVIEGAAHGAHISRPDAWALFVRATVDLGRPSSSVHPAVDGNQDAAHIV
jgi:pimeloyl-ACP methyl ester carboxylesterase